MLRGEGLRLCGSGRRGQGKAVFVLEQGQGSRMTLPTAVLLTSPRRRRRTSSVHSFLWVEKGEQDAFALLIFWWKTPPRVAAAGPPRRW